MTASTTSPAGRPLGQRRGVPARARVSSPVSRCGGRTSRTPKRPPVLATQHLEPGGERGLGGGVLAHLVGRQVGQDRRQHGHPPALARGERRRRRADQRHRPEHVDREQLVDHRGVGLDRRAEGGHADRDHQQVEPAQLLDRRVDRTPAGVAVDGVEQHGLGVEPLGQRDERLVPSRPPTTTRAPRPCSASASPVPRAPLAPATSVRAPSRSMTPMMLGCNGTGLTRVVRG